MGVKANELRQMMVGVDHATISDIQAAARSWKSTAVALREVAHNMRTHKVNVTDSFGEQSEVTTAAHASFDEAAKHLNSKAEQLLTTASSLQQTAGVLTSARSTLDGWDARPPASSDTPADASAAGKQEDIDETTAQNHITAINSAYGDTITQMKTVDELPGQPPAPPSTDPGAPSYPSTGEAGGSGPGSSSSSPSTSPTWYTLEPIHQTAGTTHTPSGPTHTTTGTHVPTDAGSNTGTGTGTGTGFGGWFQGGPGTSPTYPTSEPYAPAASAGATGAAGAGAPVAGGLSAGILGGAGAAGGLGSYGSAGLPSALRFSPGQTIGGAPQSVAAGVLGAEERVAAGGRSVVSAGAGAGGAGGRGGAAGGGRGAAGRRGVAGSGGGRDRKRDRDPSAPEDMWDDGSDWIDDEVAGPEVVR